jgi:quercetin dioxygenase-like cupin family protein
MSGIFTRKDIWMSKVWGRTRLVHASENSETHELWTGKAGGFCSIHKHANKANVFIVMRGHIRVLVEDKAQPNGLACHELKSGCSLYVGPGVLHQFQVREDGSRLIEVYFDLTGKPVDGSDIERITVGGISNTPFTDDCRKWRFGT